MVEDNNPCGSQEFKQFVQEWMFKYILSSPNYPKSNVLSEKAVGIAKKMIKKAKYENDINLFLLNYRNCPAADLPYSPAQLMMSRELRTTVNWMNKKIFTPKVVNCKEKNIGIRFQQKLYYDKTSSKREETVFKPKENVAMFDCNRKEWTKGEIVSKTVEPRSYIVKNNRNNIVRRNTIHMKKVKKYKSLYDDIRDKVEESTESEGIRKEEIKERKSEGKKEVIRNKKKNDINLRPTLVRFHFRLSIPLAFQLVLHHSISAYDC